MFLKVFKYDFKAIFFKFLPMLAILPVISILVRIISLVNFSGNVFASMIWGLFNGILILGCVLFMVYTLVICIMRYTKALFRDQGYLTHTLPVTKHQLLLSQILADVLMELISLVVVILCCMIAYFDLRVMEAIVYLINQFFEVVIPVSEFFNLFGGSLVLFIFCIIFSFLQSLFVIYTGIGIGHAFPKNKGILSVVFCIVLNYGIGIVTSIISFIVGAVGDFAILELENMIQMANIYLSISLVESIIICIGAYFLDIYLMKHKLNLE
ncbi:MAG: hypothetical protein NC310_05425 [Roseburia sp.]|nr:hypothetical protein [Anaeroplasma bactoclasticum]MCM1196501.1 hypothetical protein [Roseburia sp.]MCM1556439.1 hypothetical protein [Anaeroplasma bactoclasticum]